MDVDNGETEGGAESIVAVALVAGPTPIIGAPPVVIIDVGNGVTEGGVESTGEVVLVAAPTPIIGAPTGIIIAVDNVEIEGGAENCGAAILSKTVKTWECRIENAARSVRANLVHAEMLPALIHQWYMQRCCQRLPASLIATLCSKLATNLLAVALDYRYHQGTQNWLCSPASSVPQMKKL